MFKYPFVRFVRTRTVQNKFNILIGLIILILLFSLLNFWFGIKVMSGIRGYVGGEGLWSKAQKEALSNLVQYASTGNETYYKNYLDLTVVQLGDKHARLELDKPSPNYDLVRQGFIQGGNAIGDIDDMIFLYRQFKQVSYMREAIHAWQSGDEEIAKLRQVAGQIHTLVASGARANSKDAETDHTAQLALLLQQAYAIDARLTGLENHFSASLGSGSRNISNALLRLTIFTTVMLGLLAVAVATFIARAIIRLDKLKTEFVSLASHQLRTPLTAINWYTEALLSGANEKFTESQQKYLLELSNGGRRMSALIGDLLNVSSLELGTYKSEAKDASLTAILETVVKDLQNQIDKKKLVLNRSVQPDLPSIKIDQQLVTAIFQNLLSNSIKYTPNEGTIAIAVKRQKQNLLIHVADNGIGVPAHQQSQIFTKLFRADNAKQLDADGTGLGLYIVKALAVRAGGSAWFRSTEGHGSDFYVKLPLYRGIHDRRSN